MEEKDFAAALHQSNYDFGVLTGTYGNYENFKLKPAKEYRNTDTFKNVPEEDFNKWYKSVEQAYNEYENGRVANPTSISAGYALDDPISRTIGLVSAPNLSVSFLPNKREYTKSYDNIEKARYSMHEVAQKNTYYKDHDTGKMIDNGDGVGGILDFFSIGAKKGGLWLAHDENKNPVTDIYGNYYYETIGTRDTSGKEHLMLSFDNAITDEDSALNNFDFMDSDQIEQNVGRSLIKEGLKVASLFNPVTKGLLAAGWLATTGMSLFGEAYKSVSALSNAFANGSFDPDKYKPSKEAEDIGNTITNWGKMLTISSQTEQAQRDPFSMEGILSMIGSGATQIAGQRLLMEAPLFIKSVADPNFQKALQAGDKSAKRFLNVAKNAATAYMTAQSAQEVGEQFERAGFDKGTKDIFMGIAAITLGAFYKISPFETWMLDKFDDKIAKSQVKKILKETMDDFKKVYSPQAINNMSEPQKAAVASSFMNTVKKKLQGIGDFLGKGYSGNEIIKGVVGEGLEEPTEVIFGEVFKTAAQVMNKFNLLDEKDASKYKALNPWGEDFFSELAVSAVAGALAGGTTGIVDRIQNGKNNDRLQTLSDIVQSGYTDTALKQIENLRKANIASNNLSAVYYDTIDGKRVYRSYNSNDPTDISQADYIANTMAADIKKLKTAYEGIGATKDEFDGISQRFNKVAGGANLFQAASLSSIVNDARSVSRELVKVQLEKEKVLNDIAGRDPAGSDARNKEILKQLEAKEKELQEKFEYYRSIGKDANPIIEDYLEEALFNKNYVLQQGFNVKNKIDFITNEDGSMKKGADLKKALDDWEKYRTTQRPKELREAFIQAKSKISKSPEGDPYFRALYNQGDKESDEKIKIKQAALDNKLFRLANEYKESDEGRKKEILKEIDTIISTPGYIPSSDVLPYIYPGYKVSSDTGKNDIGFDNYYVKDKDGKILEDKEFTLEKYISKLPINSPVIDLFEDDPLNKLYIELGSDKTKSEKLEELKKHLDLLEDEDLDDDYLELKNKIKNLKSLDELLDLIIENSEEKVKEHLLDVKENLPLYNTIAQKVGNNPDSSFVPRSIVDNEVQSTIEKLRSQADTMQSDFKGDDIENELEELIDKINQKRAILQIPAYIKPIINKLKSLEPSYFSGKKRETETPDISKDEANVIDNMYRAQLKQASDLLKLARLNGKVQTKSIEARYIYGALQVVKNIVAKVGISGYSYDDELIEILNSDEKTIAAKSNLEQLAFKSYQELIKLNKKLHEIYKKGGEEADKLKNALKASKKSMIDVGSERSMDNPEDLADMMLVSMMRGDIDAFFEKIHAIKKEITKDPNGKVPTFEQEMVLFQAFSAYQYHEKLKIKSVKSRGSKVTAVDNTIPEIETPGFNRGIFINSNPGIGKTEVLINYLARLLESVTADYTISSPKQEIVDNVLYGVFKSTSEPGSVESKIKKKIKNPSLVKITGQVDNKSTPRMVEKSAFTSKSDVIVPDYDLKKTDKPVNKYLILDEATHLTKSDIQLLHDSDQFVFMFGDTNQLGATINLENGTSAPVKTPTLSYLPGIERSPRITMSFRNRTENYDSNAMTLARLSNTVHDANISEIDNVYEVNAKNNPLFFNYSKKDTKGVTVYSKELEDEIIAKANAEGASYVIIDDVIGKSTDPNVLSFKEIQGREFDYVIIRKLPDDTGMGMNPFEKIQTLNTLLSRYKRAMLLPVSKNNNYYGIEVKFNDVEKVVDQLVMTPEKAESMKNISLAATSRTSSGTIKGSVPVSGSPIGTGVPTPEKSGTSSSTTSSTSKEELSPEEEALSVPAGTYAGLKRIDDKLDEDDYSDDGDDFAKQNVFFYFGESKQPSFKDAIDVFNQLINGTSLYDVTLNGKNIGNSIRIVKENYEDKLFYKIKYGDTTLFRFPGIDGISSLTDAEKTALKNKLESLIKPTPLTKEEINEIGLLFTNGEGVEPTVMPFKRNRLSSPLNQEDYLKIHEEQGVYITPTFILTVDPINTVLDEDGNTIETLLLSELKKAFGYIPIYTIDDIPDENIKNIIRSEFNRYRKLLGRAISFVTTDIEFKNSSPEDATSTKNILKQYMLSNILSRIDKFKNEYANKRMSIIFRKAKKDSLSRYLYRVKQKYDLIKQIIKKDPNVEIDAFFEAAMDISDLRRIGLSIYEHVVKQLEAGNYTDPLLAKLISKDASTRITLGEPVYTKDSSGKVVEKYKVGDSISITEALFGFSVDKDPSGKYYITEHYPVEGDKKDGKKVPYIKSRKINNTDVPIILQNSDDRSTRIAMDMGKNLDYTQDSTLITSLGTYKFNNDRGRVNSSFLLYQLIDAINTDNLNNASDEASSIKEIENALSMLGVTIGSINYRTGIIWNKLDKDNYSAAASPDADLDYENNKEIFPTIAIPKSKISKFIGIAPTPSKSTSTTPTPDTTTSTPGTSSSSITSSTVVTPESSSRPTSTDAVISTDVKSIPTIELDTEIDEITPPAKPYILNVTYPTDKNTPVPNTYVFTNTGQEINEALENQLGLWVNSFGDDVGIETSKIPPADLRKMIFGNNTDIEVLVYDEMLNGMFGDIFLYNPRTGEMGLTHDKVKQLNNKIKATREQVNKDTLQLFTEMGFKSTGDLNNDVVLMLKLLLDIDPGKINHNAKKQIAVFLAYNVGHHLIKGNVFADLNRVIKVTTDKNQKIVYSMTNIVKEHSYMQESGEVDGLEGGSQFLTAFLNRYEKVSPTVTKDDKGNVVIDFDNVQTVSNVFVNKGELLYGWEEVIDTLNALNIKYDSEDINDVLVKGMETAKANPNKFSYRALNTLATLNMILGVENSTDPINISTSAFTSTSSSKRYSINNMINNKNLTSGQIKALYDLRSAFINMFKLKQVKPDMVINGQATKESDRIKNTIVSRYTEKIESLDIGSMINDIREYIEEYYYIAYNKITKRNVIVLKSDKAENEAILKLVNSLFKVLEEKEVNNLFINPQKIINFVNNIINGGNDPEIRSQALNELASIKMESEQSLKTKTTFSTVDGNSSGIFSNTNVILSNIYNRIATMWNDLNNCSK
jgi:hypothetical protein